MKIRSSSDGAIKRGGAVTLNCTARCTFHQLEVTWYRDGHALQFTGPALHLGPLTAKDSGNYTCGLKKDERSLSSPYASGLRLLTTASGLRLLVVHNVSRLL
ncbi:hypothetical protein EYF80_015953 [Liparis tanakae]|uniref:Ig-like domain-containing protein n=1 Tax=Liparis tanakae TaxID=230148 RepID=A0A4Z2I8K8_9TELE|nr:hypothetical protein EYF80_015953 [Liparis tanakae]